MLISAHEMNPLLPVMDRIVYLAAGRAASGTHRGGRPRRRPQRALRPPRRRPARPRPRPRRRRRGGTTRDLELTRRAASSETAGHLVSHFLSRGVFETGLLREHAPCTRRCSSARSSPSSPASVGVFTVIRSQSFAGEALGDLGATGGSGAFLVGVNPLWGFVAVGARRRGARSSCSASSARAGATSRPGSCWARASASPRCSCTSTRPTTTRRARPDDPVRLALRDRTS